MSQVKNDQARNIEKDGREAKEGLERHIRVSSGSSNGSIESLIATLVAQLADGDRPPMVPSYLWFDVCPGQALTESEVFRQLHPMIRPWRDDLSTLSHVPPSEIIVFFKHAAITIMSLDGSWQWSAWKEVEGQCSDTLKTLRRSRDVLLKDASTLRQYGLHHETEKTDTSLHEYFCDRRCVAWTLGVDGEAED